MINYFRGRRARGGKLFPRTQINGAGSAAVLVVTTPAATATPSATATTARRKPPRTPVGREGKAPPPGRRHLPRPQAAPGQSRRPRWAAAAPGARAFHSLGSFTVKSGWPGPHTVAGPAWPCGLGRPCAVLSAAACRRGPALGRPRLRFP